MRTKAGKVKGGGRCGERGVCEELGDTNDADADGHDMAAMFRGLGPGKSPCDRGEGEL